MCRYITHPVKHHYVCSDCRRSKKSSGQTTCELCRRPMVDMGQDFKPPRKLSLIQWRKIAILVENGRTFHSCGCTGPGPAPKTYSEAKALYALEKRKPGVFGSKK